MAYSHCSSRDKENTNPLIDGVMNVFRLTKE